MRSYLFIKISLIVILLAPIASICAVAKTPKKLKPLVVLIEHNPWLTGINADEPTIVIYTKGYIIYKAINDKNQCSFFSVQLGRKAFDSLKETLNVEDDSLYTLPGHIDPYKKKGLSIFDQPTNELYLFARNKEKRISIYGELSAPTVLKELPKYLSTLIGKLKHYQNNTATAWLPDHIELMLWPKDHVTKTKTWPADWPGFSKCVANTEPHTSYAYTLNIDARYLTAMQNLLASINDDEALLMDGHKWATLYRFPMPAEKWWKRQD